MNNFKIYGNAYSIYRNTVEAIPNLLNFNFNDENLTNKFSGENITNRKLKLKYGKKYEVLSKIYN